MNTFLTIAAAFWAGVCAAVIGVVIASRMVPPFR